MKPGWSIPTRWDENSKVASEGRRATWLITADPERLAMTLKSILSAVSFTIMLVPTLSVAESSFGVCEWTSSRGVGLPPEKNRVEWDFDSDRGKNQSILTHYFSTGKKEAHGEVVNVTHTTNGENINMRFRPNYEIEMVVKHYSLDGSYAISVIYFDADLRPDGKRLVLTAYNLGSDDNVQCLLR